MVASGNVNLQYDNITLGPSGYAIIGPVQYNAAAMDEIHLQPEFHIAPDPSGFGHFYIDQNMFEVVSFHQNGFTNIPTYSRFELGIKLPAAIQSQIDAFLSTLSGPAPGINPYDPDQIKIECKVLTPGGWYFSRYGYYFQEYTVNNNQYFQVPTAHPFRIRMAPPEAGTYHCTITVTIPGQPTLTWNDLQFTAVVSGSHGHLKMAPVDYRRMQFEDGTPYFGMGQNFNANPVYTWYTNDPDNVNALTNSPVTPYPNWVLTHDPTRNPSFDLAYLDGQSYGVPSAHGGIGGKSSPAMQNEVRNYLSDLAAKGGNFARLRIDPHNYSVEYGDMRTDVGGAKYDVRNCITNYQPNQMFLKELDWTLDRCEQKGIYVMLNLLFEVMFAGGGGDCRWELNPYAYLSLPPGTQLNSGSVASSTEIQDFFTSPLYKNTYKKQLYYISARWGYSTNIAMWEMINETGAIPGYSSNPQLKTDVADWICEMTQYLKSYYPVHLATDGTIPGDGMADLLWNNYQSYNGAPCLDIYSQNNYSNEVDASQLHYNFKDALHESGFAHFTMGMPYVSGELGLGCNCIANSGVNPNRFLEPNVYNDRAFHNTIWATAMSGDVATGLNYFDQDQQYVDHRSNFKALKKLVDKVKWQKILKPMRYHYHWENQRSDNNKKLFNFYMMDTVQRNYVVGWSMMENSFWTYDQPYAPYAAFNDNIACVGYDPNANPADYDIAPNPGEPWIEIREMGMANHWYKMRIFDPYDPATPQGLNWVQSDQNKIITFRLPFYNHRSENTNWVGPDRAYIIYDADEDFTPNESDNQAGGQAFPPVTDEGNNVGSRAGQGADSEEHSHVNSGQPLIREASTVQELQELEKGVEEIRAFPNPANTFIKVIYNANLFTNVEIEMYDISGKLMKLFKGNKQLDVQDLDAGMYTIKFRSDQADKIFKIAITR